MSLQREAPAQPEPIVFNANRKGCPTRSLLDRIGDRWTVLVVMVLGDDRVRYGEIARRIEGISQKMLTQTLKSLEADGLVTRTSYPEVPPRVEYELTPLGLTLREPLRELTRWANEHVSDILDSRARHARR